jgi:hypothetical protein
VAVWCLGQADVPTNLDFFSSVADSVGVDAMRRLGLDSGMRVSLIENESDNDVSRFVLDRFTHVLMNNGVDVYTAADTLKTDLKVSFIVTKAFLEYEKWHRHGFLSGGDIERKVEVGISLRAANAQSGRVVWVGDIVKEAMDRVPFPLLDRVEQGGVVLGRPRRPQGRGVRRWIEPVLVAATIGTAAYLFYVVRSR